MRFLLRAWALPVRSVPTVAVKLAPLDFLDEVPACRVRALVCCPLCDEPLELAEGAVDGLVCGCSREAYLPLEDPRRWDRVDSDAGRPCDVPLALKIVMERYGFDGAPPRTVAEVARRRGISRSRVRELEGRVLVALRRILR